MMPPDIASIDSDINKLSQLTPAGGNNFGGPNWGLEFNNPNLGGYPSEFSGAKSNYSHNFNMNGYGYQQFDNDQASLYDSKYSPSRGGASVGYQRELTSQQHMIYGANKSSNKYYDHH
jgi:hypothetical protein